MREPLDRFRRFLSELKRRSVYQVAVAYAVVGFVLIEAADLIFPALNIPSWAYSLVVVLVLFGFPIALVIAWAFEVTPEGVKRTPAADEPVEAASAGSATTGLPGWIVVLGIVALAGAGVWYLAAAGDGASSGATAAATDSVRGDEALHHLGMAMEEGEIRHQVFRVDPFFEDLRSDPRFQEIVGNMAARQEEFREEVLQMDFDLYPPGSETDG